MDHRLPHLLEDRPRRGEGLLAAAHHKGQRRRFRAGHPAGDRGVQGVEAGLGCRRMRDSAM